MKIDLWCPRCDAHTQVEIHCPGVHRNHSVEGWCATAHLKPVRMVEEDPHAVDG